MLYTNALSINRRNRRPMEPVGRVPSDFGPSVFAPLQLFLQLAIILLGTVAAYRASVDIPPGFSGRVRGKD